jgi:hypothetical protein
MFRQVVCSQYHRSLSIGNRQSHMSHNKITFACVCYRTNMMSQALTLHHKTYGLGKTYRVMRDIGWGKPKWGWWDRLLAPVINLLTRQKEHVAFVHVDILEFAIVHHLDQQLALDLIKPFLKYKQAPNSWDSRGFLPCKQILPLSRWYDSPIVC